MEQYKDQLISMPSFLKELNPDVYFDEEDWIVADFETTNLDYGSPIIVDNRILLGSFYSPRWGLDTATPGTTKWDRWIKRIKGASFIVCHNSKFELAWLYRLYPDLIGLVLHFDTMLAEYCVRGNLRPGPLDLDSVCKQYGISGKESIVSTWIKGGIDPCLIPKRRLREYCENDVEITLLLFLKLRDKLKELGLLPVFFTRCLTTIVLAEVEMRGMNIDATAVEKEFHKTLEQSRLCLEELNEITGGINPKSPKQVGECLYDKLGFEELRDRQGNPSRTDAGGRKTDEATVAALTARTDEQRRFSEAIRRYSPIKKRLETLTKLHDCSKSGELLHANFNQAVTVTHRLSSSGKKYKVQFQNVDRKMKKLFKSRHEGWLIGAADGKQLEFRVAGELSRDPQILKDIEEGIDVHLNTAVALYGKSKDKITKDERTEAKPFTFRPIYGGSGGSPEIRKYCNWFQNHYNVLFKTQEGWVHSVATAQTKSIQTASGLILYWPDCHIDSRGNITRRTEIFNYPVQSFATADIIPITLVYLWYRMRGWKSFLTNTVHDSIVTELESTEYEKWEFAVKKSFTGDVFNYVEKVYGRRMAIPLGVSYNVAANWDQGVDKEFEYSQAA